MRRLMFTVVASTTGCNSILGIEGLAEPELCLGEMNICAEPIAATLRLESSLFDTDADPRCETRMQTSGPDLCLIAARSITLAGEILVVGTRPLMLFASDSIVLSTGAKLDASSRGGERTGAAANSTDCPSGTPPGKANAAGGGAGGSFGTRGGNGGTGDGNALGGTAATAIAAIALRGGCSGFLGGVYEVDGTAAGAGDSGGAIALLAGTTITIEAGAYVLASGAGGSGALAAMRGGGGGGGSGGMIRLEAPMLRIEGQVVAHGGGGGEGATATPGGARGEDGANEFLDTTNGGSSASPGGDGGNGSSHTTGAGNGLDGGSNGGGGGGGGGAGVVVVRGTASPTAPMITPTPM